MKYKHFLLSAALLTFAISLMIYPAKATASCIKKDFSVTSVNYTLFPPLCFVNEMYETEDKNEEITADEIISDENVEIKVKFKLFEIKKDFFGRLF